MQQDQDQAAKLKNIETRVLSVVKEQLGLSETPTLGQKFMIELGADSLDLYELTMGLEDEFGIEIPDEAGEKLTTSQEAIDYIASHT